MPGGKPGGKPGRKIPAATELQNERDDLEEEQDHRQTPNGQTTFR